LSSNFNRGQFLSMSFDILQKKGKYFIKCQLLLVSKIHF